MSPEHFAREQVGLLLVNTSRKDQQMTCKLFCVGVSSSCRNLAESSL